MNGIALQDYSGTSPLLSEAGLALADVGAGVEVIARWRVIVNIPLPPATAIETSAKVVWDEAAEITIAAAPMPVEAPVTRTTLLPVILAMVFLPVRS